MEPMSPALSDAIETCGGTSLDADSDFWANYAELRQLGRGCFGTVLLVEERAAPVAAVYAAKIVTDDAIADALNEAALLRSLHHPNIVRLHDVYASHSTIFMLMGAELGGDLSARAASAPNGVLSEPEARLHLDGLLRAVRHIHDRQIVHRDIKATNVLLSRDGEVKLGDFGLAARLPESGRLTSVCGTHDYLAPEMIRTGHGECSGYGCAVDMWAIGLLLHSLVVGDNPFERDTDIATLQAILAGDYTQPSEERASEPMRALLAALLTTDPERRVTAEEAASHRWLAGEAKPTHRRKPSFGLIERLWARAG